VGIPVIPVRLLPLLSVVAAGYSLPAYRFVLAEMPENLVSCAVWGSGGAAAAADGGWGRWPPRRRAHTQLWVLSQPCRDFHNNH
jgi:hypothetical protein